MLGGCSYWQHWLGKEERVPRVLSERGMNQDKERSVSLFVRMSRLNDINEDQKEKVGKRWET